MDINMENAKEEFIKYTENYDLTDENLGGKQKHSLRVMQISEEIARDLKLNQEEIKLAALIGLLHDIARFEQYTKYKTFRDLDSIDHGDYGAKILEKEIRKYIELPQYDEIIIKAVKNHNKYKMEDGLSEKEELFAKIIRDADKIDILFEICKFWKTYSKAGKRSSGIIIYCLQKSNSVPCLFVPALYDKAYDNDFAFIYKL